jgi:NAD(P)-dependent dehydrogenase (short-subunit alcohol dehydrogenase family)
MDDKTVLITGGGSGIGRATALLFAREGARVFLVGRRPEPLEGVAEEIHVAGGEARSHSADLRDDESIRAAVDEAVRVFGGVDVLINNAGLAPEWTPVHETPDKVWEEVLDINLTGTFRVTRAALPHLIERKGAIVNVSSTSALKASNSVASYSAAKAGLIAFSRCVAAEYGWQGVRCNCVVPSWVETPMTEGFLSDPGTREDVAGRHALQRVAGPEEVARTILHLASAESSFITGVALPVDGGMTAL